MPIAQAERWNQLNRAYRLTTAKVTLNVDLPLLNCSPSCFTSFREKYHLTPAIHLDFFDSPSPFEKGLSLSISLSAALQVFSRGICKLCVISIGRSESLFSSRNSFRVARMSQIDLESSEIFRTSRGASRML